jgi:hypothetical protein
VRTGSGGWARSSRLINQFDVSGVGDCELGFEGDAPILGACFATFQLLTRENDANVAKKKDYFISVQSNPSRILFIWEEFPEFFRGDTASTGNSPATLNPFVDI